MSWSRPRPQGGTWARGDGSIDSVQWIDLAAPPAEDLAALERRYFAWVPIIGGQLSAADPARVGTDQPLSIRVRPLGWPTAIRMTAPEVVAGRRARRIVGGLLAHPGGALAFEVFPSGRSARVRVALVGFRPRMPRFVYLMTQRRLHERSTFAFLREVARHAP